jgi:carboxyl-terminal processing protease
MRHRYLRFILILLFAAAAGSVGATAQEVSPSSLVPTQRQVKTTIVINKVLERFHYRKVALNDDFAQHIFKTYLKALDPNRSFFLQGDVNRFEHTIHRMDEGLKQGKLDTAFEIFRVYRQRVDERVDYALDQLDEGFDFDQPELYKFDRSKDPWASSRAELDEIWHKRVKNDWLSLRLTKKADADIRETLRKRYEGLARRVHQFDSDDVFQAFINAYTESLEPHTSYMSPSTSENFDISMRLSLEGIGAVLRGDNEYTVVQRTIPGGPAKQSGQIHSGDRIVGVAQGLDGAMEDVVGWRLQDVVNLIRGPKGSVVRLQILPSSAGSDGKTRQISLVRNEIKLEDQASKSYVIQGKGEDFGTRIGVIEVPAFYRDFRAESEGRRNFRSTTRDVRELVEELKAKGVDGIVIDLRGNGGGSLTEATALTGLFIDKGPVVQVKDSFGKVEVETDPEPGVAYRGPLAVLVDRNSASASEIFAAAIQDYGRGLIIGEPTFGKGTVQTLIDLNRYIPGNKDDLGRLRLTMAEFFRVSGGSTQLRGVVPDIELPIPGDSSDHGERSLDNPLPWARIRSASYRSASDVAGPVGLETLRQRSLARIKHDPGFKMLIARGKVLEELSEQKVVSLREKDRQIESARREKVLKDQRDQYLRSQGITPLDEDEEHVDDDALEKQQEVIGRIEVREAARILVDATREQDAERVRAAMRN